jgi:hypothetical protein
MKRILALLFLAASQPGFCQTDTLTRFFNFNTSGLISSPNGGYVSGNNGYGDKEKLQAFIPDTNYSVLGALVWMGNIKRNAANPENSSVWLKMRRFDASPVANVPFVRGPQEVLDSVSFALDVLQADSTYALGWNYLPFNTPVFAGQPYGLSLSFEDLEPGDTCAIQHSAEDSVLGAGNSWEIWNGNWRRMIDNWDLNIDFAIFPVIDTTLNLTPSISEFEFEVYPNPANEKAFIQLAEPIKEKSIHVFVYNLAGIRQDVVATLKDQYSIELDLDQLSSGAYLVYIESNSEIGLAKLLVQKK